MSKAEEFLEKRCLQINKRHWKTGEKKLYQIGAKTLQLYADEQSRERAWAAWQEAIREIHIIGSSVESERELFNNWIIQQ